MSIMNLQFVKLCVILPDGTVLGPFDTFNKAYSARANWARDTENDENLAEILSAEYIDSDYLRKFGRVSD